MLRNHLITMLSEKDNDTVVVNVNGIFVDIEAVTNDRGCIVLVLNPEDMQDATNRAGSEKLNGDANE